MEYPIWLVVVMGLGVVFVGLICIIIISSVMSAIIRLIERNKAPETVSAPAPTAAMSPEEKGKFIAAVSSVIAEELGTGVEAIRITSIRKI